MNHLAGPRDGRLTASSRRVDRPRLCGSRRDRAYARDARRDRRRGRRNGRSRNARPDLIVNCAAFNDVDGAENRAAEAFAINAFAVRSLARAAEACGATLVHYSIRLRVRRHGRPQPYDEDARASPRSVYASSKLLGEWFALEAPRAYVLRVESLFGSPRGLDRPARHARCASSTVSRRVARSRSSPIASSRRATSSDVAAATRHLVERRRRPGCITA